MAGRRVNGGGTIMIRAATQKRPLVSGYIREGRAMRFSRRMFYTASDAEMYAYNWMKRVECFLAAKAEIAEAV